MASAGVGRGRVRVAVVGDVHNDWTLEEDSKALHFLQVIMATRMFNLLKAFQIFSSPKQLFLGIMTVGTRISFQRKIKEADTALKSKKNLGEQHVGYKCLDFPTIKLSVVGGRPFSCGGNRIFRPKLLSKWLSGMVSPPRKTKCIRQTQYCYLFLLGELLLLFIIGNLSTIVYLILRLLCRYGVNDMAESAKRIYDAATNAPKEHAVILLAHNGPTGLGSRMEDICGRDWVAGGGDHGDPDLEQAISDLQRETGVSIPLVVFGHMHKSLAYGRGLRKMIAFGANRTIYLNGAVVPRVNHAQSSRQPAISTSEKTGLEGLTGLMVPTSRAFTIVDLFEGAVEKISEVWVTVGDARTELEQELVLYKQPREHI
uniref:Calcineurin-like phosphoesterase domain-containing protein n=1 Tax=Oryza barthii TaxID=65489 RepID=A0A0D3GDI8_9ORYZ